MTFTFLPFAIILGKPEACPQGFIHSFIQIRIGHLLDLDTVLGTDTLVDKTQMAFALMDLIFLERYR